jgi:hypothetical protein
LIACPLHGATTPKRDAGPERVGDVARCQMSVRLLDHARVGVARILRGGQERHVGHDRQDRHACFQRVEVNGGGKRHRKNE